MQEKVEIITNHIVHFWTILDKNIQKRILWDGELKTFTLLPNLAKLKLVRTKHQSRLQDPTLHCSVS